MISPLPKAVHPSSSKVVLGLTPGCEFPGRGLSLTDLADRSRTNRAGALN